MPPSGYKWTALSNTTLGVFMASVGRRLAETDRARPLYLRRFYDRDADDPALYHLMLDSTAVPLPVCADLIATAARAARAGGYVVGCAP
jgi:hypothetical protein